MTQISAQLIKDLRERSGVGMSKCKEALVEAEGDIEKAVDILRKKGLASAVKKEGRETKEGVIATYENDKAIALLEVNTETDFVAKNEKFQKFTANLASQSAKTMPADVESFLKESYEVEPSNTVDEYRNLLIQSIGENIQVSRVQTIHKKENHSYGIYSHMGGKIVTVVEIKGSQDEQKLAKDIAMHVAADDPQFLSPSDIPANVRRKEEEIAREQIKGKPENIIEKILMGKMKAFEEQECLINQKFVKDTSITVEQAVKQKAKEVNKDLSIASFWRWKVGESA